MSYSAFTITHVEPHHNPNEGRVIINNNFDGLSASLTTLALSGIGDSFLALSGGTVTGLTYFTNQLSANTFSSGTIYIAAGSVTAPSLTFSGDIDTGIFLNTQNSIAFAASGVTALFFNQYGQFNRDGSEATPSISFQNALNSGLYLEGSGINFSISGTKVGSFKSAYFSATTIYTPQLTTDTLIAGTGHTITGGLTNVAIAGGSNITATTSNTLYAQKITLKESTLAPLNFPIFTSNPSSPSNGDVWILSGATGNALLSLRIGGATKTVELT